MPQTFQMVYHGGRTSTMGVDFMWLLSKTKAVRHPTLRQPNLI